MSISYEEIGQVTVTCQAGTDVEKGQVVKLSGNDTVAPCAAGEAFCGVAHQVSEDGYAAVQLKGAVTLSCAAGGVQTGWASLTADGSGGVKAAGSTDKGVSALVLRADTDSIVVYL